MCSSCHEHPFKADAEKLSVRVWGLCAPALKSARAMREANLRLALSIDGKRPTKFGGDGVIVFELARPNPKELERRETQRKAEAELLRAEAELARAHSTVQVAQADADRAMLSLQSAKQRLAEAEKTFADLKKPKAQPQGDAAFTVHVRTLTAAEKVIRVKATGKETVLEALVYAADEIPLMTGSVSVWLVRDKAVLPVDIPAITQKGDSKTNYTLKPGDQLFLQAKPAK
jgi:hypothetical protein